MRSAAVDPRHAALVLVDIQPDFLPGGALPVADGDQILDPIARLMGSDVFSLQVATQDWHAPGHASFASGYPNKVPMDSIELHGHAQTLWPDHCVQGTPGAELIRGLPWERVSLILRKGTDRDTDSYSGFRNNWNSHGERPPTGLAGCLRERGVQAIVLCGLARDVCVKWTAEDGVHAGFEVYFLWDLTRSVNPGGDDTLRGELERAGVHVTEARDILK